MDSSLAPEICEHIGGSIKYYGLEEWWLTAFDEGERAYIKARFQPLGRSADSLTAGEISYSSQSRLMFLVSLAGWFGKAQDRALGYEILDKALSLSVSADVLDVHFLYDQMIKSYYKDRMLPGLLDKALDACGKQIALAPMAAKAFLAKHQSMPLPSHRGYEQLAIVLEKQGQYHEAIACARQAMSQGWCGDWSNRMGRCESKLAKA